MYQKEYSERAPQKKSQRAGGTLEMLGYNSCDNTCTNKDILKMHKGVTHKANLSNGYKSDYSGTKNEVSLMHVFRKQ
jgi:hypothetical protein